MSMSSTSRRNVLKLGALAAAPLAALPPTAAAALADDGTRGMLAQMEDEKAIERLTRAFLRRFNGADADACGDLVASSDAILLDPDLDAIAEDAAQDAVIDLAPDGTSATYQRACSIERISLFAGNSTIEQMARFQGQEIARASSKATLDARFARTANGWIITRLTVA